MREAGTATLDFEPGEPRSARSRRHDVGPPQSLTLRNLGGPPLVTDAALVLNGPDPYDFRCARHVHARRRIAAGGRRADLYFNFTPAARARAARSLIVDAPQLASLAILTIAGMGVAAALPPTVDVIEFYNASPTTISSRRCRGAAASTAAGRPGLVADRLSFRAYAADAIARECCRSAASSARPASAPTRISSRRTPTDARS